ncbi:MAG: type II secretion system protein M [Verrucomicrobia bacterium]|nr:type II secretion system protein M [Verrucomicrobiota bacterium]
MAESTFSKLRPGERRLVLGVGTVVFLLFNLLYLWPQASQWGETSEALAAARKKLETYQAEIAQSEARKKRLRELKGRGLALLPQEQALQLMRAVQKHADRFGVTITQTRTAPPSAAARTNLFFDERAVNVGIQCDTQALVDFLYALGADESMIRVRDMEIHPNPQRYHLQGNLTLVANYQKSSGRRSGGAKPRPQPSTSKRKEKP